MYWSFKTQSWQVDCQVTEVTWKCNLMTRFWKVNIQVRIECCNMWSNDKYIELSKFGHDFTQRLTFSSCILEFIISIMTYILHGHDWVLTCLFMCRLDVLAIDATKTRYRHMYLDVLSHVYDSTCTRKTSM